MNDNIEPLNTNAKFDSEAQRVAKGMLKVYDMEPMQIKSKHPELWEMLLDIEAGGESNAK